MVWASPFGVTRKQILRDFGGRLDSPELDLVGVVEPKRLRVDPHQAGDLSLRDAEAG